MRPGECKLYTFFQQQDNEKVLANDALFLQSEDCAKGKTIMVLPYPLPLSLQLLLNSQVEAGINKTRKLEQHT